MSGTKLLPFLLLSLSSLLLPPPSGWDALAADTLAVAAVGDVMMGSAWPDEILPPRDGEGIFDDVREAFRGADIVFGNLEGPLLDEGEGIKCGKKRRSKKSLCYEFRTPVRYVRHLDSAGFNVMNIANNHSFDFGALGAENTVAALEAAGIQPAGGDNVAAFWIRGKTVAVVGFSYSPPSPHSHPLQDIPGAMEFVEGLKEDFDLVVVSVHGGAEGKDAMYVADADEIFAGENRGNVVRFARSVIDAGADLVIGHGPHVPRAMEVYKGKLIAYSLGNFLTYGRFNLQGASGVSFVLKAEIDMETGNFARGEIVPVRLLEWGIPFLDPEKMSLSIVRELTAALPRPPGQVPGLVIGEGGVLTPAAPRETCPAEGPAPEEN
jgi:poly-gamma-glutamate capsule biosynthesis protein CapA/YwtB (metallophosphatase superfamily)